MRRQLRLCLLVSMVCGSVGCSSGAEPGNDTDQTVQLLSCSGLPKWALGTYSAGAQVQDGGNAYKCKPWPYSGWCGQAGYEPGVGAAWQDAWVLLGPCDAVTDAGSQDARSDSGSQDSGSRDARSDSGSQDSGDGGDGGNGVTTTLNPIADTYASALT